MPESKPICSRAVIQTLNPGGLSKMCHPLTVHAMISSRLFSSGIVLVATALSVGTVRAQAEHHNVPGSSIAVYDLVGHVQVEQGSGSDVVVEVTRGGRDAKKLKVDVGEMDGRNTLRVIYPDDDIVYPDLGRWSNTDLRVNSDGTFGDNRDSRDGSDDRRDRGDRGNRSWDGHRVHIKGSGSGTEAWADLKILVPAGKDLAVYIGVGELGAAHVNTNLRLSGASARITINGTKGNLTAETGSGGIDVRGATGDDVRIETGSGGVSANDLSGKRLRIGTGSGGVTGDGFTSDDLQIDVGSGSIRVDDARAPRVRLDAGSGGIHMSFASPVKSLDVQNGSGGVTISLPAAVNADVDIETGSGGIDSDFPVTVNRMERNRLRGQIGDGSGHIRIESGSGSVHLRKM
jgi:lia operon protein LiaG